MIPVSISYGDWSYKGDLPQSLAEVPFKLLRPVMRELLRPNIDYAYCRIACLLLNIPSKWWRRMPDDVRAQIVGLTCDIGFSAGGPEGLRDSETATPLLEEFKHNGVTYVLAKAEGNNVRCSEYAFADGYLEDFAEDPSEINMLRIIATYAREESYDKELSLKRSDRRVPIYSRDEVDARAKELKGLAPEVATAVFIYAIGLKKFVHDMYAEWLFGGTPDPDDDEPDDEPEPHSDDPDFGWWGIYMRLGKEGAFGNIDQVHQSFLHDVCAYLVQEEVQARRNEKAKPPPNLEA